MIVDKGMGILYNCRGMDKIEFRIKPSDKRNEMHFDVQRRSRAQVYEDKRFKKPKHSKHSMNWGYE